MILNKGCRRLRELELQLKRQSKCDKLFTIDRNYTELLPEEEHIPVWNNTLKAYVRNIPSFTQADVIRVTIDGKEYEVKKHERPNGTIYYGEPPLFDNQILWLNYDFQITFAPAPNDTCQFLYRYGGRHIIKIEAVEKIVSSVSDDFRLAVQYVVNNQ